MSFVSIDALIRDLKENPVEKGGHLYHPIPFSEFNELKTSSKSDEVAKKWNVIYNYSEKITFKNLKDLSVLDVGANAGYYTFNFAKNGSKVTSFEPHERYKDIGKFIADEKQLPVVWHGEPFNEEKVRGNKFDIALMLSTFQWMAAGGDNMSKAAKQLKFISETSDFLFFELGYNKGKSCLKTKRINHYSALISFLRENTVYKNYKLIARTRLWGQNARYLVICGNNPNIEDHLLRRIVRGIMI